MRRADLRSHYEKTSSASMNAGQRTNTDANLILATLSGDRESFDEIVRRYEGPLLHLAFSRLGNRELAEEAVQEAFVSAYRSLATYNSKYSFRTWLWTILLNQCKQKYRRLQKFLTESAHHLENNEQLRRVAAPQQNGPLQMAISNERTEYVKQLLDSLPDSQSTALRLRFFGGLRYQEIAVTMNCSLSTAKMRVRVGLEKLSRYVESTESIDSGAGESGT